MFGVSPLATDNSDTVNGIFTVRVLNEQTSPVTTAAITVMVSVRGADNLEFSAPKEIESDLYSYSVQSDETCLGEPSRADPNLNLVYMGEKVVSFRQLMMRSNYTNGFPILENATGEYLEKVVMARRPLYKGYDPNGIHVATGITSAAPERYNFVKLSPYHLISSCFLGERGSFTWNLNINGYQPSTVFVDRSPEILTKAKYAPIGTFMNSNLMGPYCKVMSSDLRTAAGSLMLNERTNTGVSFNAPMYSNFTMYDTSPATRTLGKTGLTTKDSVTINYIDKNYKNRGSDYYHAQAWFNVGPDFSTVFFLNIPTYYVYSTTPAAVS
jgi:hypothetical protein